MSCIVVPSCGNSLSLFVAQPVMTDTASTALIQPNDFITLLIVSNLASKFFKVDGQFAVNVYCDLLMRWNINCGKSLAIQFVDPVLNIAHTTGQDLVKCLIGLQRSSAIADSGRIIITKGQGDACACCCNQTVVRDVLFCVRLAITGNAWDPILVTDIANPTGYGVSGA